MHARPLWSATMDDASSMDRAVFFNPFTLEMDEWMGGEVGL